MYEPTKDDLKLLPYVRAVIRAEDAEVAATEAQKQAYANRDFPTLAEDEIEAIYKLVGLRSDAQEAAHLAREAYEKKARRIGVWSSYRRIDNVAYRRTLESYVRELDAQQAASGVEVAEIVPWVLPDHIQKESVWVCDECDAVTNDEPDSPLYECGSCGTRFGRENSADGMSHRCPDCNRFASKSGDFACSDCGSGEMVMQDGFECPECGEIIALTDGEEHLGEHVNEVG